MPCLYTGRYWLLGPITELSDNSYKILPYLLYIYYFEKLHLQFYEIHYHNALFNYINRSCFIAIIAILCFLILSFAHINRNIFTIDKDKFLTFYTYHSFKEMTFTICPALCRSERQLLKFQMLWLFGHECLALPEKAAK